MPYYRNIGLIGKARSGKDTVAKRLGQRYAYQRVAFADPLKEMALRIDPIVIPDAYPQHDGPVRLSQIVSGMGWESAKDNYPEVRRILQHCGQTMREADPDFWLRIALDKVREHNDAQLPVVVSDVRYRNEALSLRRAGFKLVRIVRPPNGTALTMREIRAAMHASETELDGFTADLTLHNAGSLDELHKSADLLTV